MLNGASFITYCIVLVCLSLYLCGPHGLGSELVIVTEMVNFSHIYFLLQEPLSYSWVHKCH